MKLFKKTSAIHPDKDSSPSQSLKIMRRESLNESMELMNLTHKKTFKLSKFLTDQVPIYTLQKRHYQFQAQYHPKMSECFLAKGDLIGKVYELDAVLHLHDVKFVGRFNGVLDEEEVMEKGVVYFEGTIEGFRIIELEGFECSDEELQLIQMEDETRFKGLFKGNFYSWESLGGQDNVNESSLRIKDTLMRISSSPNHHCYEMASLQMKERASQIEYFLPSLIRFEVEDIREINLAKSMAVTSGYLHLEIRLNEQVSRMLDHTIEVLTKEVSTLRIRKFKEKFKLDLGFSRDINITLPLIPFQDGDSEHESDSQWSLGDKPDDIEYEYDRQGHKLKYRIMKGFKCQLDNTFGVFFAPFNLNVLRMVVGTHHFSVYNEDNQEVKMNLVCMDTADYETKEGYNPFRPFNDLIQDEEGTHSMEANRLYKLSRQNCEDTGQFILADNRMVSYPYYRHVLRNSNTNSQDWLWAIGKRSKISLIQIPPTESIKQSFIEFEQDISSFEMFSFQKFSYQIIELPIYKYVIIDMIKVFGPLTLLAIISLFIFQQQNGIGTNNFTTLAYRLVNVGSLMISYVSLISLSRTSLPPTPGVTLVEMLTYVLIVPNLLALINSMVFYTHSKQEWKDQYFLWTDWVFMLAFFINFACLALLIVVLVIYWFKEYNVRPVSLPLLHEHQVEWRAPLYKQFMENVRTQRKEYIIRQLS